MPAKMEKNLREQALKKGLEGDRKNAFVYGTMRKTGWKPSREGRAGALSRMGRGK